MILILTIILILFQVGAYKLANKVKMSYPYLKVLVVFLVLNFSVYPYLFDLIGPEERLPGFELTDSNYLIRSFSVGAAMILITHLICYMNNRAKTRVKS